MARVFGVCRFVAVVAALALAGGDGAGAAGQSTRRSPGYYPRSFPDVGITLLDESASDLDVSQDGRLLAYPRRDPRDWYMDVWTVRPNGTERRCLTCELSTPSKHQGSVAWHPSGRYLAFSAENDDVRTRKGDRLAEPGIGLNTNLWVVTADGSRAWKLTDYQTDYERPRGVIHPQFSRDGKRICWGGPVDRARTGKGYEWGEWALFVANFEVDAGVPALRNIRTLQPGAQHSYYEPDDWSADNRHLLISANTQPGQSVGGQDICELDVDAGTLRRVTHTHRAWNEYAHYSRDGRRILWASSRGLGARLRSVAGQDWRRDLETELWVMNRDGSGARRLTFFNDEGRRDCSWFRASVFAARHVVVADNAFLGDGGRAAVALAYQTDEGQWNGVLAIVDLERRRQAQAPEQQH